MALLVWGCHNQSSSSNTNTATPAQTDTIKHVQVNAKPLNKGMTDTVVCASDPSQKYAVYVPSGYDAKKQWPIIYFFDPHGAGNFPLELYKSLADKYGYILAGTYGSQNGMQWNDIEKAAQTFMQDSWQHLSIDNNRIYTFGFSGGARVACSVAIYDGGVTGVAACGGGFPERSPNIRQPFTFIGFVGEKDFNYTEMKQLDNELDQSPLTHQLIVYHGKHQWPPEEVAEQAFQWFDVNAMKMQSMPKNDSMINALQKQFIKQADEYDKKKDVVNEYFTYKKMINYIGNLADMGKYSTIMQSLAKSDKVQQYISSEQTNMQQEMQMEGEFINYLSDKDIDWWKGTVQQMRDYIKKDSLSPAALTNQRLLSYLSLATYMGAIQAFRSQNDGSTVHFLQLYQLVDPTNPEHSYLFACVYARQNNSAKAISNLQDAVKLGFNDAKRAEADSNFTALKSMPEFKVLVKKMKAMPHKMDMAE